MCVWEGCSDLYREFTRQGGILSLFGDLWFDKYVLPVQHGLGERGWRSHIVDDWVSGPNTADAAALAATRHDWRTDVRENRLASDAFWKERLPDFSKITVPLLSSGNWGGQGLHLRGNIEGYLRAQSKQKWLDFHCHEHWTEFYTSTGIALQKRFFAHFLKGEDNGWAAEPRVQMLVRNPTVPVTALAVRKDDNWPLTGTTWTRLYLDPARASLETQPQPQPPMAAHSVRFKSMGEGVTFLTPPLAQDTHIIGPSAAQLRVSSSTEDADLFLILRLFTPDMKEITYSGSNDPHTPMTHGWLRASSRKLDTAASLPYRPYHTHDEVQKLVPGIACDLAIEILPTCFVAPAGYRIALTIRGKDYEYPGDLGGGAGQIGQPSTGVGPFRHIDPQDRPAAVFDNEVTLHFDGAQPPYLLLPVVPPSC